MAIPEEDRGPVWMRDYGYIDIDIDAVTDIGDKLRFEHENFVPHMRKVVDDMSTPLPGPAGFFTELVEALRKHHAAQQATVESLQQQAIGIEVMARAARELGVRYRDADSFAAARAQDVEYQFVEQSATAQDGSATIPDPNQAVAVPNPLGQSPDGRNVPIGDGVGGV